MPTERLPAGRRGLPGGRGCLHGYFCESHLHKICLLFWYMQRVNQRHAMRRVQCQHRGFENEKNFVRISQGWQGKYCRAPDLKR